MKDGPSSGNTCARGITAPKPFMKRVLFDVPKWHLLLHREFRELSLPNDGDAPWLRLEDELFERLHPGELDSLRPTR